MSGFLAKFFGSGERRRRSERLLDAITRQARQPVFFDTFGVADSLDGRFDMMVLHGAMVFRALRRKGGAEASALAQDTTDLMFMAFDDAIRSLGVGDQGVPRRVKTMAKAYIGRSQAYVDAITARDPSALADALVRNVYRGTPSPALAPAALADYVLAESARLETLALEAFSSGALGFSAPILEAAT